MIRSFLFLNYLPIVHTVSFDLQRNDDSWLKGHFIFRSLDTIFPLLFDLNSFVRLKCFSVKVDLCALSCLCYLTGAKVEEGHWRQRHCWRFQLKSSSTLVRSHTPASPPTWSGWREKGKFSHDTANLILLGSNTSQSYRHYLPTLWGFLWWKLNDTFH